MWTAAVRAVQGGRTQPGAGGDQCDRPAVGPHRGDCTGYIAGHGVIDAKKLQELAAQATLRIVQAPMCPPVRHCGISRRRR